MVREGSGRCETVQSSRALHHPRAHPSPSLRRYPPLSVVFSEKKGPLSHRTLVSTGRSWNRLVLLSYSPTSATMWRFIPAGTLSGALLAGKWKS